MTLRQKWLWCVTTFTNYRLYCPPPRTSWLFSEQFLDLLEHCNSLTSYSLSLETSTSTMTVHSTPTLHVWMISFGCSACSSLWIHPLIKHRHLLDWLMASCSPLKYYRSSFWSLLWPSLPWCHHTLVSINLCWGTQHLCHSLTEPKRRFVQPPLCSLSPLAVDPDSISYTVFDKHTSATQHKVLKCHSSPIVQCHE